MNICLLSVGSGLSHTEKVYVTMLGGLHIEMAFWRLYGDLLESSGWTTALSESSVASTGTGDSFLKVSHLTRTRHSHLNTALVLSKLRHDAFILDNDKQDEESFKVWRADLLKVEPNIQCQVQNLTETITEIGNPYRDDFKKLVALDTHNCADASVITTVNTIEERMPPSYYVAKIFDGTVIVLALPLSTVTTFSKYADKVSLPFLTTQLQTAIRIDVVCDTYHSESLKEATREKRGKGARKRVSDKTKLPKNWNKFLLDAVNK
ncbi:hypothetical protein GQR58_028061 [Nymphon striatum]|nr:hypothetical protein GQR58_028061 [Nymphon striatum]